MFDTDGVSSGAPGLFSNELFVTWIHKLILAYQEQKEEENELYIPKGTKYSKAYYTKKIN